VTRRVLAVDGGNTKTLAVVADEGARVLGTGRGGCGDIYGAGSPDAALGAIAGAVSVALAEAGLEPAALDAAAFSLAGADWPEDFELLDRELRERLGLRPPPVVVNDALGALRAGSPGWTGLAVVAGTYNAIGARHEGRTFHVGFWPDGAGGRHLGDEALRAVYRADLGLGGRTVLSERAFALYGVPDATALLHAFTRRGGLGEAEGDRMAPVVIDAADAGDPVATEIVTGKGRILGRQARISAERVGLPLAGARVVLTGGVFGHPSALLADTVMAELPGAVALRHGPPPVAGALLLALDRLGVDGDAAVAAGALSTSHGRSPEWAPSPSSA